MKDRIQKIIDDHGLTNSQFADKVGIPRSGLSHVLSGRNRPSLDYMLKIMEAFPEVDSEWLLKGKRITPVSPMNSGIENVNRKVGEQAEKLVQNVVGLDGKKDPENALDVRNEVLANRSESSEISIERIVVFYSNGRFKEYLP